MSWAAVASLSVTEGRSVESMQSITAYASSSLPHVPSEWRWL